MLLLIFIVFAILITIIGGLINRARKRRMVSALGREVNDSELTSLNAWMDVAEKEDAKKQP
jgi:hypothetical protein